VLQIGEIPAGARNLSWGSVPAMPMTPEKQHRLNEKGQGRQGFTFEHDSSLPSRDPLQGHSLEGSTDGNTQVPLCKTTDQPRLGEHSNAQQCTAGLSSLKQI